MMEFIDLSTLVTWQVETRASTFPSAFLFNKWEFVMGTAITMGTEIDKNQLAHDARMF